MATAATTAVPVPVLVWIPASLYAHMRRVLTKKKCLKKSKVEFLHPHVKATVPLLDGKHMWRDGVVDKAALEAAVGIRQSTIVAAANGFSQRRKDRDGVANVGSQRDRLINPLVATHSAPGGGKTTLLDILAGLSSAGAWTPELCADADMRGILNACVPIYVTHNSGSDPDPMGMDADETVGLAMRILYDFFAKEVADVRFGVDNLFKTFAGLPRVTASAAIRCCLHAAAEKLPVGERAGISKSPGVPPAQPGVLLLVDEVVKMYKYKKGMVPESNLLGIIGGLLDTFGSEKLNAVVTTLDTVYTARVGLGSGRPVTYAPLPPLTQVAGESMLLAAWHKELRAAAGATALPTALPYYMRVAVSDACGHPRTLQWVREAWLDGLGGAADAALRAADAARAAREAAAAAPADAALRAARGLAAQASLKAQSAAIAELRRRVCRMVTPVGVGSTGLSRIAAALAAVPHPLDSIPGAGSQTLRQLIEMGVFVNAIQNGANLVVIPRLTFYQLLRFANVGLDDNKPKAVSAGSTVDEVAEHSAWPKSSLGHWRTAGWMTGRRAALG